MMDFLRLHSDDRRAGELCASALHTGRRALGAAPPLPTAEYFTLLDLLRARFPSHAETKRLPWHRANVLLHEGKYAEAERLLTPVGPGSGVYALAQYGLAAAAAKQAEALEAKPPADPNEMARLLGRAAAAIGRFVGTASNGPSGSQVVVAHADNGGGPDALHKAAWIRKSSACVSFNGRTARKDEGEGTFAVFFNSSRTLANCRSN